ncbi:acyl-CoA dehydrogenase [Gordonia amarae]|uniref:Acyl-CoA dehydrogenase n=2 Tax=Gordonia amarae TaxID=36821 RepID=A0A857L0Z6_9ACTN|nr:acyl-CoA dehydrogenase [Gordonia amarae]MCS3880194.1 butyryl-CoA dehydrogenase [Gordonia amarae]QHN18552.1 acyl-CoA dehydrogenase [Gordonia amarae]QHN23035.1 acyl-CoA dehydrogenase [Gordonia amarae]QHN31936.1 acyl-CoA dehydrogenase [Gordonia amarae]QHN40683.1 acyl-CoA dehydrogenase [Gordonia amarae]
MADPISRRDLDFQLYEWLDVEQLTKFERYADHSKDTFDAVLDLAQDIAIKKYAPFNKLLDQNEPYVGEDGKVVLPDVTAEGVREFLAAGLIAGPFGEELDGGSLPATVHQAAMTWFQAANPAMSSYTFLTVGNANLLATYGTPDQIDTWVKPMLEGRYFGTMCLSEPGAGSSLSDITTKATPVGDGTYRVTGTKMWISAGDHELGENIVHLVLAKAPGGGPGVKGISLFIVPKFLEDGTRNDVALVGLNHKMGQRGTTNTLLNFGDGTFPVGDDQGAVGYLVGEEHKGLFYMFHMMNEARIGVGFLATAIGYAGYLQSVEYAKTRLQGRPVDAKDPASKPVAIIDHPDVKRMLLAQKSYVEGGLALGLWSSTLVDRAATATDEDERARAALLLDVITPISKSWPSQWCLTANDLAIQVHGGYGYTKEFDVEQCYRDNRLNPIHEGTHGVQAIDLLGRKFVMKGGAGLQVLIETLTETIDRATAAGGTAAEYAATLRPYVERIPATVMTVWADGDPAVALANATAFLEAAGHTVLAWLWLEQFLAAAGKDGDFYDGKRAATQYFFTYELPKTGPMFDLVAAKDRTTIDTPSDWF